MSNDSILGIAAQYINAGFQVHPCTGKIPKIKDWPNKKLTLEEFESHYTLGDALGIVTGKSSRIACVDIDFKTHGSGWYEFFKDELGTPLVEHTPGGLHLYYRYPEGLEFIPSKLGWETNVDLLVDGGKQVITAPSKLASGEYWIEDNYTLLDVSAVADFLPQWIYKDLLDVTTSPRTPQNGAISPWPRVDPSPEAIGWCIEAVRQFSGAIQGQSGDEKTFLAAKICWRHGLTAETAFRVLLEHYNAKCVPPWTEEGLRRKIRNAYNYSSYPPGGVLPESQFEAELGNFQEKKTLNTEKTGKTKESVVLSLTDFLDQSFAKREHYLGPFVKQGITLVYAATGVGKTHFCMGVAFAIASGEDFLAWKCEQRAKVLYIDGELPAHYLQSMLRPLYASARSKDIEFKLITPDTQNDALMPDLATPEGQSAVSSAVDWADVIFVDNLSTLVRTGKENEAEYWIPVQSWMLGLRRKGKSVIFAHHAGKGETGSFRGTSKITDAVDLAVFLKRPAQHKAEDGCVFEISFPKYRHYRKGDATEFVASYVNTEFGPPSWSWTGLEVVNSNKVLELHDGGMTPADIAADLGLSRKTVYKHLKNADIVLPSKESKVKRRVDIDDVF